MSPVELAGSVANTGGPASATVSWWVMPGQLCFEDATFRITSSPFASGGIYGIA
jgi:hypothetical protein